MRLKSAALVATLVLSLAPSFAHAQSSSSSSSPASPSISVPRLINLAGVFRPADGQPIGGVETVTFAIYADETDGTPLWQETQQVNADASGRYSVLLGATRAEGVPLEVFASGEARWLGMIWTRGGESQARRSRLTFVPYAVHATDADTLGGKPASAYALSSSTTASATGSSTTSAADPVNTNSTLPGTPGQLAKYAANGADIMGATTVESGGRLGVGTTAPLDYVHAQFTDASGGFTGFAVQNLSGGAAAYSGTLFYDQNGALGQFQGFNNSTHEYRINNVARNGGGQFNGSINFMTGGTSRFIVASTGNIGIGTTSPSALLEVSNAVPGGPANMWMTSFTNFVGPYYMARRSRGTPGAPSAVLNGDLLAGFFGQGYGTTGFGPTSNGSMQVQAAQNWTDAAQGTALTFTTTSNNTTAPLTRMTVNHDGNVGIGTSSPSQILEVNNGVSTNPVANIVGVTYNGTGLGSSFTGRTARGTLSTPAAVQNGDALASLNGKGYTGTTFATLSGGQILIRAAENFTDAAQGTSIEFRTTPLGGTALGGPVMKVNPNGDVGIGTGAPSSALEVVRDGSGDIRLTNYSGVPHLLLRRTRGTSAAPTAVINAQTLGVFQMAGYGTTGFSTPRALMGASATEDWTDTAQGTRLLFGVTPTGTVATQIYLVLNADGMVGIDMPVDVNGNPLPALDPLEVFGDIRVGTAGTNGCIKDFSGAGIVGTCSSDLRLKKDITPFGAVLDRLASLQPVHYFWRADEFPDRHFGTSQAAGLIAQDVEKVLPELVETDKDGFKAINYSKLPLFTIQAVKELKSQNDALQAETESLKQRVAELESVKQRMAELERLLNELRAATVRR